MNSSESLVAWEARHRSVLQRRRHDLAEAKKKLELAQRNLARARRQIAEADPDQALINAETAIVNAADALLARDGYRVRGKTGGHTARFEYPALPHLFRDLQDEIETARSLRNIAQYDEADRVPLSTAEALTAAAGRLLAAVTAEIDR